MKSKYFREYFCSFSSKSYYFYILGVSHLKCRKCFIQHINYHFTKPKCVSSIFLQTTCYKSWKIWYRFISMQCSNLPLVRPSQTGKNSPRTSKTDSPVVRSDECNFCVKNIINQLFMNLQQQIHTLLERWIPSRKQPFCLCWCTCSVVHDGKDLSISVWSPAVNDVSVIELGNHGPVSRGQPVNGSTAHKPTTCTTFIVDKQVSEFGLSIRNLSLT